MAARRTAADRGCRHDASSDRYGCIAAYVGTIVAANWAITRYGMVPVGFGLLAPAGVYLAGLAFTLRDIGQDLAGRAGVLAAIAVGAAVSIAVAPPALAAASAVAFAPSELADMAVYTPLRERRWLLAVAASNAVGLVVDSVLFLAVAFGSLHTRRSGRREGVDDRCRGRAACRCPLGSEGRRVMWFLGSHQPGWLAKAAVPLFVSDRRLRVYKTLPVAAAPWALDSGGFTELQYFGGWRTTPAEYIDRVRRYRDEIGHLAWAAPQDWMCEPVVIAGGRVGPMRFVGTGLSVREHQRRTVDNLLRLRDMAPDLPWIPVVQGFRLDEYLACVDMYDKAGVDLTREPLVGLGSVCRRQGTGEAHQIITALHDRGVGRLHGFGVKILGLQRYSHLLASADSMAWSVDARLARRPLTGCTGHKNCANCLRYALRWRDRVLRAATDMQLCLPLREAS